MLGYFVLGSWFRSRIKLVLLAAIGYTIYLLQAPVFFPVHRSSCEQTKAVALYKLRHKVSNQESNGLSTHAWKGANQPLPGLLSYDQRYTDLQNPQVCYRPSLSPVAIVIRIGPEHKWSDDFILSVRAIVVEVGWAYSAEVYILQHVESVSLKSVPREFWPFMLQVTTHDLFHGYSRNVTKPLPNPPSKIPLIAQLNHMTEVWFMLQHKHEFAWFVESDVRSTGHWHTMLQHIESEASAKSNRTIDLITFGPHFAPEPDWHWATSLLQFPKSSWTMALLQVHRISRSLALAMHQELQAGRNAYFECFIPTVATKAGLQKFTFANPIFSDTESTFDQHPFKGIACLSTKNPSLKNDNLIYSNLLKEDEFCHGTTYSPATGFTPRYYEQWKNGQFSAPPSFLHPVKL